MRVGIDEARQYQLAGYVDHLSGAGRQNVALHRRDLAVADGDVPDPVDAGGRADHAAAAQKLVEGGADRHEQSPLSSPAALPRLARIRSILRILQEQTSCHDLAVAKPIESSYSR
jgi:hypothetical protein